MPMVRGCERAQAHVHSLHVILILITEHGIVSRVSRPFFSSRPTPQRSKGLLAQTTLSHMAAEGAIAIYTCSSW